MNNKVLILRERRDDYFLKYINNSDIQNIYYKTPNFDSIFFKVIKKFRIKLVSIFLDKWKRDIQNYDTIIIFDKGYEEVISKYIKSKNKKCKIILYMWNNLNERNLWVLKDRYIDEIWSFNELDAKKYNLKFNDQFYSKNVSLKKETLSSDITFLGRNKNRKDEILKIKKQLIKNGIKTDFTIIEKETDFISYEDYLNKVSKSRAILDIVEDSSTSGITLRVLETLFFKKKLITNNQTIKNKAFFNKSNIYILKDDELEGINEFFNEPYCDIDQQIVDYYDFNNWINRFNTGDEKNNAPEIN